MRAHASWTVAGACLASVLVCAGVRADEPDMPSPEHLDSHEQFQKLLETSRATTYAHILSIYDEWLASHPDAITVALERCRFILGAGRDDEEYDEGAAPETEDCSEQLFQRYPNNGTVIIFRFEQLWGPKAIEFGEKIAKGEHILWFGPQRGRFAQLLAEAYASQRKQDDAIKWARIAREFDPGVDVSLILAEHFRKLGQTEAAVAELVRPSSEKLGGFQKVHMLVELGAFDQAVTMIEALNKQGVQVGALLHAKALEGAGRTNEARAKYGEIAGQQWNRKQVLQRLFYIDLRRGERDAAVASYAALRKEGFSADPLGRHRLALTLAFPGAPWQLRDVLGVLALFGVCLLAGLLPLLVIIPIHYVGLLRGSRAVPTTPAGERWSLWQLWGVSSAILIVQFAASYLFAYASLPASLGGASSNNEFAEVDLFHFLLWTVLCSAAALSIWMRRDDYARLIRCTWSTRRVCGVVALCALGVLAVHGLSLGIAHAFDATKDGTWELGFGLTTFDMLRAAAREGGPFVLIPLCALVVPMYEEVAFRSVFLGSAGRHLPFWGAAVLQAAVFAGAHDGAVRWPGLFAMGLIAALLTRRSGGLMPALVLHGTINLFAAVAVFASLSLGAKLSHAETALDRDSTHVAANGAQPS